MRFIQGDGIPPALVGFLRGLLEAAVMAGLIAGVAYATSSDAPAALQLYTPLFVLGGRTLEGLADHIDPAKKRDPNAPPPP